MEQVTLARKQQQIFDYIESTNDNVCVCGEPGVGKSVLIRALKENGQKRYILAAPTGLAALNIDDAKTLHSLFRLPVSQGIIHPSFDNYPTDPQVISFIKGVIKHLIIDEISMVRADMFDYLDRLLQYVNGNDKPFGGIQVIIIGDFFQLPPVVIAEEKVQLKEAGYQSPFVFDSFAFKSGGFKIQQLNEVFRQKGDPEFLDLLGAAREGLVTQGHIKLLNTRVARLEGIRIALTGTNNQALNINMTKLKALGNPIKCFNASVFGQWPGSQSNPTFPTDRELYLCVGAQVIVKKNGADCPPNIEGKFKPTVVNGTLGIVKEIAENKLLLEVIEKGKSREVWVYKQSWERKRKEQDVTTGKWSEVVIASFDQLPVSLAWAISIHKSQGQTFSEVHIDPSKIFAAGQMYVALSRCKTLAGITFESKLDSRKFFTDKNVLRFNDLIQEYA
jgi:GTPase SAR1 family protein